MDKTVMRLLTLKQHTAVLVLLEEAYKHLLETGDITIDNRIDDTINAMDLDDLAQIPKSTHTYLNLRIDMAARRISQTELAET